MLAFKTLAFNLQRPLYLQVRSVLAIKGENRAVGHVFDSCPKSHLISLFFLKIARTFSECSVLFAQLCLHCSLLARKRTSCNELFTCCPMLIMSLSFALVMSCFDKPCALILNGLFASKWVEPFFNGPRDILQYHNLSCFLAVQTCSLSMYCSNFFVCARTFSVHSHETNSHKTNQQITRLIKYNMFVIFKTSNKDFVSTYTIRIVPTPFKKLS